MEEKRHETMKARKYERSVNRLALQLEQQDKWIKNTNKAHRVRA